MSYLEELDQLDNNPEELLAGLNKEQKEAVMYLNGPLLILAGAGSGKTRVITQRIAYMIQKHHVPHSAILAITFTNKAANEMKERIAQSIGSKMKGIWVGTFHAIMAKILRRHAEKIGYASQYTILDITDQKSIIKNIIKTLNLDTDLFKDSAVLGRISDQKSKLISPEAFAKNAGSDYRNAKIAEIYKRYMIHLKENNSMDFDDLLYLGIELFENHPETLNYYQEKFQYISVDEYQDTNYAQYRMIYLLSKKHKNICVVGDDDQSIYSFRGADITNILNFERDFKNCKVIKLEQNYRSTDMILSASNAVISNNKKRTGKSLWTSKAGGEKVNLLVLPSQTSEGKMIASEIDRFIRQQRMQGETVKFKDISILYRINALSRTYEGALREQGIPYAIYGGIRFYERKEIKDILAYLRLILNPFDVMAFSRAINVPKRGVGDVSLDALLNVARETNQDFITICETADSYPSLKRIAQKILPFAYTLKKLTKELLDTDELLSEWVERVELETGIIQEIIDEKEKGKTEKIDRIENLKELISDVQEFEKDPDLFDDFEDEFAIDYQNKKDLLEGFLQKAALYGDVEQTQDADAVKLSTIHSAKGLEFDCVFIGAVEEGIFPGFRSMGAEDDIEEERRLAYVAMTRAKKKLYLTAATQRILFGKTSSNSISRFVTEIPDDYIEYIGSSKHTAQEKNREDAIVQNLNWREIGQSKRKELGSSVFNTKPKTEDASKYLGHQDFKKGMRVKHPKFGIGEVKQVEAVAADALIRIAFPVGEKTWMAKQVKLERV